MLERLANRLSFLVRAYSPIAAFVAITALLAMRYDPGTPITRSVGYPVHEYVNGQGWKVNNNATCQSYPDSNILKTLAWFLAALIPLAYVSDGLMTHRHALHKVPGEEILALYGMQSVVALICFFVIYLMGASVTSVKTLVILASPQVILFTIFLVAENCYTRFANSVLPVINDRRDARDERAAEARQRRRSEIKNTALSGSGSQGQRKHQVLSVTNQDQIDFGAGSFPLQQRT